MNGLIMDYPLTVTHILHRARRLFPGKRICTLTPGGMQYRTYGEFADRAARLSRALASLGIGAGDRVGTFAWNTHQHLELYFAIPCRGSVLHTVNIRLHPDQLVYIINHAEDRLLFVDATLLPAIAAIRDRLKTVEKVILLGADPAKPRPEGVDLEYEALLESAAAEGDPWPELDEESAAILCYTSGTTGNPKGVLYSHRALFLHSMAVAMADTFGISERDRVLPVVPMFHANCWGVPFCCAMVGADLVFTGPFLQPRDLAGLIEKERVTIAFGVPTIWSGLLQYLEQNRHDLSSLRSMTVGGSAVPRSMIEAFQKKFGVPIVQAWGMTETGPLGTVSRLTTELQQRPEEEQYRLRATQGTAVPGVELRGVDAEGNEIPWDGETLGEVQVRGPWIASRYYKEKESGQMAPGGWFRTGDVASISPEGYMQIADRTKDLIKSGGEWISSVDLENAIMGHPKVLEACVIAVPHTKWAERPLACIVPKPGFEEQISREEILAHLEPLVARWWLPDAIEFIETVPKTSVGKFDKKVLRQKFSDYRLTE